MINDKMLKSPEAGSAGLGDEPKGPAGLGDGMKYFRLAKVMLG